MNARQEDSHKMGKQNTAMVRRIVDIFMTVLLLFLMAYQVTGEVLHEWIGMGMTLLVIIHQILNRRWYASVFKKNRQGFSVIQLPRGIAPFYLLTRTNVCKHVFGMIY